MIRLGQVSASWSKNLWRRFGHVVQTWLQGTTTVPIEIGKERVVPEKLVEVEGGWAR